MTSSIDRLVAAAKHNVAFYVSLAEDLQVHALHSHASRIRQAQDRRHVAMVNEFRKRRAERLWRENQERLHHEWRTLNTFPMTHPKGN